MARRVLSCWLLLPALAACSASPGAADVEQAWLCSDLHGARPVMQVRNLACEPGRDRTSCSYEAMIGTETGSWVRVRGDFRRYSGTGAWCFDTRPAILPDNPAQ